MIGEDVMNISYLQWVEVTPQHCKFPGCYAEEGKLSRARVRVEFNIQNVETYIHDTGNLYTQVNWSQRYTKNEDNTQKEHAEGTWEQYGSWYNKKTQDN